jgi:fumarylacetoacetate (FAA) hydrolase
MCRSIALKVCTFRLATDDPARRRVGRFEDDHVVELAVRVLQDALLSASPLQEIGEFAQTDVHLLAPVPDPPSIRDAYAFEQHVRNVAGLQTGHVPSEWYELPAFYFSNPAAVIGPNSVLPIPEGTQQLDYELEVAAVIGAGGRLGGFTIMNDWSARDLQRKEMRIGLGPAKGKDFATSLGPVVLTVDEFTGTGALMLARVNGEGRSGGELADMYWTWEDILNHAARNTRLRPGDVIGSGTVGTGCILEAGDDRWLQPGDVVELEVEGIGVLTNQVVSQATAAREG